MKTAIEKLKKKLSVLEGQIIKEPLIVVSYDDEGTEYHETVDEMIESGHEWGMKTVNGGGSLDDLSRALDWLSFKMGITPADGFLTEEFKSRADNDEFRRHEKEVLDRIETEVNKPISEKMTDILRNGDKE